MERSMSYGHINSAGPIEAANKRPPGQATGVSRWAKITTGVCVVVLVIIVVCAAVLIPRSRKHDNDRDLNPDKASGAQVACTMAAEPEFRQDCQQALTATPSSDFDGNQPRDRRSLFPMKLARAAQIHLQNLLNITHGLQITSSDGAVLNASSFCNGTIGEAVEDIDQVFQTLAAGDSTDSAALLSAFRTLTTDCAEELYLAAVNSSDPNLRAAINATESAAIQLGNALGLLSLTKDVGTSGFRLVIQRRRRLTMRRLLAEGLAATSATQPDVVVSQDGTGNFRKIQDAINQAPDNLKASDPRYIIHVRSGTYLEKVLVPKTKSKLTIVGVGPTRPVLRNDDTATTRRNGRALGTFLSYTFSVDSGLFLAVNIEFQNLAGVDAGQAVAVRVKPRKKGEVAFVDCKFEGWQDTLYSHSGYQYYYNCEISGSVDFIFGNAAAIYERCTLISKRDGLNTITAQGRTLRSDPTGFTFRFCTVGGSGSNSLTGGNAPYKMVYMGRPWKAYARTGFMFCTLNNVMPAGWMEWGGGVNNHLTADYFEYKNTGPRSDRSARVSWARELTDAEAGDFTVENFIHGGQWLNSVGVNSVWSPNT